jgi:hypothetical protein
VMMFATVGTHDPILDPILGAETVDMVV